MTSQIELDTIEACKRLSRKVERSWRGLLAVCQKLQEHGGTYTGLRKHFYRSFGASEATNEQFTRCLARAGIVKLNEARNEHATIEFLPSGVKDFLSARSGLNITTLRSPKRCPDCGVKIVQIIDGICYECYLSSKSKRESKLAKAIEGEQ